MDNARARVNDQEPTKLVKQQAARFPETGGNETVRPAAGWHRRRVAGVEGVGALSRRGNASEQQRRGNN